MKRYCNLFSLLFFILFIGNTAKCASADKASKSLHLSNTNCPSHAVAKLSMQNKKPIKTYTALLFRIGIEGKSTGLSNITFTNPLSSTTLFNTISLNNTRFKYRFSSSDYLILAPEFLLAFSCHAPPAIAKV